MNGYEETEGEKYFTPPDNHSTANREAVATLAMKFHTIERTFAKMTYETSPINTSWEDLSESFRLLYLQDATSFMLSLIQPKVLSDEERIEIINSTLEWAGDCCPHTDREEPPMNKMDCTKCFKEYLSQATVDCQLPTTYLLT